MVKNTKKEMIVGENNGENTENMDLDQSKSDLERGFEDVHNRKRRINSEMIINNNKIEEKRQEILLSLMNMMKDLGVDMSSLESIRQFIQKMQEQNPDMARLFEISFGNLLSPNNESEETSEIIPLNKKPFEKGGLLENKYGNLAKEMLFSNSQQ